MRKTTMKMKNRIRATPAAADATPPKPNTPATKATTAKMSAQVSRLPLSQCWTAGFQGTNSPQRPPERAVFRFRSETNMTGRQRVRQGRVQKRATTRSRSSPVKGLPIKGAR